MPKNKAPFTLDELFDKYSLQGETMHFSSNSEDKNIKIAVFGKLVFDADSDSAEGLRKIHFQSCHIDDNINKSNIEKSVMEKAIPSIANRPILAYIYKDTDGNYQFWKHNMHEENGETVYDEIPVGTIPESCNPQLIYDEEKKHTYLEIDGLLYEEYSKAVEILEREQEVSVSVELAIREFSFNAKEKFLDIEDFYFNGITLLGKDPNTGKNIKPGMTGSNATLVDFTNEPENTMFNGFEMLIDKLDKVLSCFENMNTKEGGTIEKMNKFEELLQKYNKTVEDVTFEYANLSDDELEAKFAEVFEEAQSEPTAPTEPEAPTTPEGTFEKVQRTYELSHSDIRCALYSLLAPFEETDNDYYWISSVYDSHFVYESTTGKLYGQNYVKDGDNVSFDGDRYELFAEYLTEAERVALNDMRSNYEALETFKSNTEKANEKAQKESILARDEFSVIATKDKDGKYVNKAYGELIRDFDKYSADELEKEAKVILADYYTKNAGKFEATGTTTVSRKQLTIPTKKPKKRYGSLFEFN